MVRCFKLADSEAPASPNRNLLASDNATRRHTEPVLAKRKRSPRHLARTSGTWTRAGEGFLAEIQTD